MARAVEGARSLGRGIFFKPEITLSAILPADVPGWTQRAWQPGDDMAITGHARVVTRLSQNPTQNVLEVFDTTQIGKQAQLIVFESPKGLVAIRLGLDLKQARRLERADAAVLTDILTPAAKDRSGRPVGDLAGFPLREEPRKTQNPNGTIHEAKYLHLNMNIGKLVAVEVIANAPRDQVLTLLSALDFETVRAALPGQQMAAAPKD